MAIRRTIPAGVPSRRGRWAKQFGWSKVKLNARVTRYPELDVLATLDRLTVPPAPEFARE